MASRGDTHMDEETSQGVVSDVLTWNGPGDPQNPLNWSSKRKWINVGLISFQATLSPMSSTILAVGSLKIAQDFGLTSIYTPNLPVGLYVLGLGLGPLFLAPLSEIHGRRVVYLVSFSLFTILNVGCAVAPNMTALSILRFLSGTCGSAGPTLGGASIGDMFLRKDRGKAQALYALGPTSGPILGPLIGAFVVNATHGWRWLMWIMVIFPAVTVFLSFALMRETYAPVILRKMVKKAGNSNNIDRIEQFAPASALFRGAMIRPYRLFLFSPICTLMCLYMALIYGILYLYLITIPLLYGPDPVFGLFSYRWQHGLTGLAYLGPGIGSGVGTFICAKYLNRSYVYMAKRHTRKTGSNEPQPESRMLFLQLGKAIIPIGLVMFAWSAQKQAHWILPLIGAAIFAVGMCMAYICIQTYLVDVYEEYGASALAAVVFTRSVVSCVLSIMGFQLFKSLGYAWGTMLIAFICVIMLPIPLILYVYGARLRKEQCPCSSTALAKS